MANRSWKVGVSALALSAGMGFVSGGARADELPTGGTVTTGSATISGDSGSLAITQTTDRAIIDWNSFSVGAGNSVTFNQPGTSSSTLNRVDGSTGTTVAGTISANGQIYLVNPNGIQITGSGVVRAAGFTATTLDIGNEDFLAGRNRFVGKGSSASVTNDGRIEIGGGGDAVLIGGRVVNNGTISAAGGRVGLAAGEDVSVDVEGDGFLTVSAPSDDVDKTKALIEGVGQIIADGGRVEARAATSADLARAAIKLSGSIEARTVRAAKGGGVTFGSVTIDGAGGSVTLGGKVTATGGKRAKGGKVTVLGREVALADAAIDVSGDAGGGTIRIGGDKTGGGTLRRATTTSVSKGSTLTADAGTAGDGGSIVVWADGTTSFGGTISARGGATGGNGGNAEVSGKAHLQLAADYESIVLADLRAPRGEAGTLLFDPGTVLILPSAGLNGDELNGPDTFTDGFIATQLNAGNLTIDTNDATGANGTAGDIILKSGINGQAAAIAWSSGFTLTLNAAQDIILETGTSIRSTTAGAGLVLNSGTGGTGLGTVSFANAGQVGLAAGRVDITYNPASNPQGSGINVMSYAGAAPASEAWASFVTAGTLTASMLVNTGFDLQNIRNNLAANYALGADIDASPIADFASLGGEAPTAAALGAGFAGSFDGRLHTIDKLSISAPDRSAVGLFGFVTATGSVSNVALTNAKVTGYELVGALVGANEGSIVRTSSSGSVLAINGTGGGLVGTNGWTTGNGLIQQSSSSANVTGRTALGGLSGVNYTQSVVEDTYATGNVTGTQNDIGGLVGYNFGRIDRTYATGRVESGPGIVAIGGVAGSLLGSSGGENHWDPATTGQPTGVGANNGGSLGVSGVTASSPAAAYVGFDPATWTLADGVRPTLAWQTAPVAAPVLTDVKVVLTNPTRQYGDGASDAFRLEKADGTPIAPADYGLYLANLGDGPNLAGILASNANAGRTGALYVAQGDLKAATGYHLVFANATESVTQRRITVTADDKSKTVGAGDPALTYLLTGGSLVFSDTLAGGLTRLPGEAVGPYAITQGALTAGSNYALTFIPGTFTIAPTPVVPPVVTLTPVAETITEPFIRTPTEIIGSRVQGPQVSGAGVGGIFAGGGGGTPGVSNIVTATIPGAEAAAAQEGTCLVELDETGAGTLRCSEVTQ